MTTKILFPFYCPSMDSRKVIEEMVRGAYIGPLKEVGLADYEIFWFGPWLSHDWADVNCLMFKKCIEYSPDILCFINGWRPDYHFDAEYFVRLSTLYLLRKTLNLRITFLWTDMSTNSFKVTNDVSSFCDIALSHEHPSSFFRVSNGAKYKTVSTVYSPSLFHGSPQEDREFDVVFIGQVDGYIDRERGIKKIQEHGIDIVVKDGKDGHLSWEQYSEYVKNSKIVVNWTKFKYGGWHQAKGRIFEATLSGCLLVSEECAAVNYWFKPHQEYVPFTSNDQLIERLLYYLKNSDERLKIAKKGNQRALNNYSANQYFKKMIALIRESNLYDNLDAISALKRNAFDNEVRSAKLLRARFMNQLPTREADFQETVSLLEIANASVVGKFNRQVRRLKYMYFNKATFVRAIRWLVPNCVTRKSLRTIFRDTENLD